MTDAHHRMLAKIKGYSLFGLNRLGHILGSFAGLDELRQLAERQLLVSGVAACRSLDLDAAKCLADTELKVFSQFGDDGILYYLTQRLDGIPKLFVEFGVEDYTEANTRFLLEAFGWQGLVIEGSRTQIQRMTSRGDYWRHPLRAECAFITRDNINEIIARNEIAGEIGILSIDIDGNDYWVWEAISIVQPHIVVCEYNAVFGPSRTITVPYDPQFKRRKAHYSHLYFGASLGALTHLAKQRGYKLLGTDSAGANAFFVRQCADIGLPELASESAYRAPAFRDSRDEMGDLSYKSPGEGIRLIAGLPVVDVTTGRTERIGDTIAPATSVT